MRLGRRSFLSLMALQFIALREKARASRAQPTPLKLGPVQKFSILQGYTDEGSSEFSIVHPRLQELDVIAVEVETGREYAPAWAHVEVRDFSEWAVQKVQFQNLELGQEYKLQVKTKGGLVVDERFFGLLDMQKDNVRFAVCSCMNDLMHRKSMWDSLREKRPEVLFFIGDCVYADYLSLWEKREADARQLWDRYVQMRGRIDFYNSKHLIPVIAVWDDHDYGANNQDRNYPHKEAAREVFEAFFAQSGSHGALNKGLGVSSSFAAFGQRFYLLDGRYFRSGPDDHDETFFGREAEEWLFEQLARHNEPSWLILGNQWFGGYREKESYEYNHPQSFGEFLNRLKTVQTPVVFVSGDVHFSEVMAIEEEILGYPTLEITSSSMHSLTAPGWHRVKHNPRRLMATSHHNFVVIESMVAPQGHLEGNVSSFGARGRHYFEHDFSLFR